MTFYTAAARWERYGQGDMSWCVLSPPEWDKWIRDFVKTYQSLANR